MSQLHISPATPGVLSLSVLSSGEFTVSTQNQPAVVEIGIYAGETALTRRVAQLAKTRASGLPAKYANAWEWAGEWVAAHGVTLPPDTSELRSLRNWFCYQVNQFKKGKLSANSTVLLAQHNIDLAKYKAPNTGRGELIDDKVMIERLQAIKDASGAFDLQANSGQDILEWQKRLLTNYFARGMSARMRGIEKQLQDFRIGHWLRPGDAPVPSSQHSWWSTARTFQVATEKCPAFRGAMDKRTPEQLASWATAQITAASAGRLTPRQRGELLSLGLLATSEISRCHDRQSALLGVRQVVEPSSVARYRSRDLTTFLGVALLARLLQRKAGPVDIYSNLGITPHQYSRLETALVPARRRLEDAIEKNTLSEVRSIYRTYSTEFDHAKEYSALPDSIQALISTDNSPRAMVLATVLLEVREIMRFVQIRQNLVECKSATRAH